MGCGSSSTEKQQNQATTSDHQIALDRVLYGAQASQKWKKLVAEKNLATAKGLSHDGTFYRDKNSGKFGSVKSTITRRQKKAKERKKK
ncbi:Hypothetical predicted protein [Mytilus galloprovincialis]|uniref:Uncharacterized protein n=1 Tax=Mytilus galloprovincialis TaxID=29158 RepID=A0A8B6FZK3_MYTGA|nr:Hypothetical predicted protein [Mytilus galloprovincialis]